MEATGAENDTGRPTMVAGGPTIDNAPESAGFVPDGLICDIAAKYGIASTPSGSPPAWNRSNLKKRTELSCKEKPFP